MESSASGPQTTGGEDYRSVAWLLRGVTGSTEGVLELSGGRLSFTSTGVYHDVPLAGADQRTGEDGRVFDVPVTEVTDVRFPWYYLPRLWEQSRTPLRRLLPQPKPVFSPRVSIIRVDSGSGPMAISTSPREDWEEPSPPSDNVHRFPQ